MKEVILDEESGTATVIVNDYQLSLAIGKEGQNARLAARLTGWRIDIKSESQLAEEEAYAAQEWAEGEWVQNEAGEMVWQPAGGGEALSAEEWEARAGDGEKTEGEWTADADAGTQASQEAGEVEAAESIGADAQAVKADAEEVKAGPADDLADDPADQSEEQLEPAEAAGPEGAPEAAASGEGVG